MKSLFLLFSLIIFMNSFAQNTVTIATDGTGNYNCNGTHDEIEINQAITDIYNQGGGTVHLKSGIFIIDNPIIMRSNIIFEGEGESNTKIKLQDEADWGVMPSANYTIYNNGESFIIGYGITQTVPSWNFTIGRIENITLQNFTIDGNKAQQHYVNLSGETVLIEHGTSNYVAIDLGDAYDSNRSNNLNFLHVKVINNLGDAISVKNANNIYIDHCQSSGIGHSACYLIDVQNVLIENNASDIYANSGIRIDIGNHIIIRNNHLFNTTGGGNFGIQISHRYTNEIMNDVLIENNLIENIPYAGIALYTDNPNITDGIIIRNNLIYRCGLPSVANESGGINIFNFNNTHIENNTIFNNSGGGIVFGVNPYYPNGLTGQKTAYIRNNIITSSIGLGIEAYGVYLDVNDNTTLVLENNNVWGNQTGNYYNCTSGNGSISTNPLFIAGTAISDKWDIPYPTLDLHLQSNSPCVDSGVTIAAIPTDYDGSIRPQGVAYDVGAYENTSTLSIINQQKLEGLKIYPNPIKDQFTISCLEPFKVCIWQMNGQKIFVDNDESLLKIIDTHVLKSGVYLLQITTSQKNINRMLIKK